MNPAMPLPSRPAPVRVRRSLGLAAAAIVFLLGACAPTPAPPPSLAPPGLEEDLLKGVAEDALAFRSIQGIARVKIKTRERSLTTTQVIFAEKPDHFRAETLSPFGQPLMLMATDGSDLTVFVPSDGRFYSGEARPESLQRLTRLPLRLEDLIRIVLYQVPMISYQSRTLHAEPEGYRLDLAGEGEGAQTLLFNRQGQLVQASYWVGDQLQLRIRYEKFSGEVHPFPRVTALEMPGDQVEARLDFSEAATNVVIPGERFLLAPPDGVAVLPIP